MAYNKEYQAEWRKKNPDYAKKWRKANADWVKTYNKTVRKKDDKK